MNPHTDPEIAPNFPPFLRTVAGTVPDSEQYLDVVWV